MTTENTQPDNAAAENATDATLREKLKADPEFRDKFKLLLDALDSMEKPTRAERVEIEEKERAQFADEKRRQVWGIMGSLIFCGVIEVPDVDITARTVDSLDDLHAQQKVLANIQYIISHIELALDQVLL